MSRFWDMGATNLRPLPKSSAVRFCYPTDQLSPFYPHSTLHGITHQTHDGCRSQIMRTTLNIDDDILAYARERANFEQKSIGEVISALVRKALPPPEITPVFRNGVPLLPVQPGATPVTLELVNRLKDELP